MKEVWKDITDYEGLYQVSNLGRVRSLGRYINPNQYLEERILKHRLNKNGYYRVNLYKNNIHKTICIHQLVALVFIDNPNEYKCINHKDENKLNNRVDNLEWCTTKYNNNYGTARIRASQHTKKPIEQYTLDGVFIRRYDGIVDANKELGLKKNDSRIGACLRKRDKTACNFIWKYAKDTG